MGTLCLALDRSCLLLSGQIAVRLVASMSFGVDYKEGTLYTALELLLSSFYMKELEIPHRVDACACSSEHCL